MPKKRNILKTILWIISILIALATLIIIILFATGVWELPSFPGFPGQTILTSFPKGVTPAIIRQTPKDPSCTFNFDKSQALVGEDVTATIKDGSLKRCVVAYDYEDTGWAIYNVENLDVDGEVTETRSSDVAGTYVWTALCGYFEGENFIIECRTNDATIEILGDCTETDGGNVITVAGITTFDGLGYMDSCIATDDRMIHEYWCEDDTLNEGNFMCPAGSTCFATRSGAYCLPPYVPPTWDVGDIVSDESGSGTMPASGGLGFEFHDLADFEVVEGGTQRLGARIHTSWDYVDQEMCFGHVMQEGMQWYFYDSSSLAWSEIDNVPQSHDVTLCPLNWDGTNLWYLDFSRTQMIVGCEVTYEWDVEIYVCE